MSSKEPRYFVLSSPSGGGKTTLLQKLFQELPNSKLSISYTTRPPRSGEIDGKDYYFISREDFQRKIQNNELLEWEEVHSYLYGTPLAELARGGDELFFDVDTQGALKLKSLYPQTILIFIQPPSLKILEERLRARGTEDPQRLQMRLDSFRREMAEKDKFDYVIVNDEVAQAVKELREIIEKES